MLKLANCWKYCIIVLFCVGAFFESRAEKKQQLEWSFLTQAWMVADSTVSEANPNFQLRRAELKAAADINGDLFSYVMIDPVKTSAIVQDLVVAFRPLGGLEIHLGQMKIPATAEGLASAAELPLPERSIVGRYFGDLRELGLQLIYKQEAIRLLAMLSNGQEPNADDIDNDKDLNLRAEYAISAGLSSGAFFRLGNMQFDDRYSYGVNLGYREGSLSSRFEAAFQSEEDGGRLGYGWMLDASYRHENWSPTLRYEQLKPYDKIDVTGIIVSAGLTRHLDDNHSKIQVAYSYLQNIDAPRGIPDAETVEADKDGHVFYLLFQAGF